MNAKKCKALRKFAHTQTNTPTSYVEGKRNVRMIDGPVDHMTGLATKVPFEYTGTNRVHPTCFRGVYRRLKKGIRA